MKKFLIIYALLLAASSAVLWAYAPEAKASEVCQCGNGATELRGNSTESELSAACDEAMSNNSGSGTDSDVGCMDDCLDTAQ